MINRGERLPYGFGLLDQLRRETDQRERCETIEERMSIKIKKSISNAAAAADQKRLSASPMVRSPKCFQPCFQLVAC